MWTAKTTSAGALNSWCSELRSLSSMQPSIKITMGMNAWLLHTSRLWKIQGDIVCLEVCARLETRCGIWHTQVQHNGWMDGTCNEMDYWDSFCLPPCFPRTTLGKNPTFSNTLEDRVATMFVCCLIVLISVLVDMLFPFCRGGNWGSGTLGNLPCPRTQK